MITLVIVGVIAAITVPTLIAKYTEQQTVTKKKKFYSEISQAYNAAIAKNGPPETWKWVNSGAGSEDIMNILAPHLRIMNRCGAGGSKDKCFGNVTYKTLNPTVNWAVNPSTYQGYSASRLDNGFVFWILSRGNCNINEGAGKQQYICANIGVDINGYKKPNALGKDTFYFYITKYGVVPIGTKGATLFPLDTYCKLSSTTDRNGYACTAWIITNGNMDYLHGDVSW